MSARILRGALVAIPVLFASAGISSAQEAAQATLPRSGEYNLIFTFVNPQPWAPIPRAADAEGTVTETVRLSTWVAWLWNVEGHGFGNDMQGRCTSMNRGGTNGVMGNCVYIDRDGDMLFEEWGRPPGEESNTFRWIGGTGKYAGIDAPPHEINSLGGEIQGNPVGVDPAVPGLYELYQTNIGTKTGTYTLPPL